MHLISLYLKEERNNVEEINLVMELFFALGFPLILLLVFTFLFISEGIPDWIQNLSSNSSTIWNFGIVLMSAITIIIYLSRR